VRTTPLFASALLLLAARGLSAQDPRLERRLDPATRAEIQAIVDSARAARLPTEPLVDRALEGAARGADRTLVIAAVRRLAAELLVARDALGSQASDAEVAAGASALRAGLLPEQLRGLHLARREQPATVALAVAADLVARGVPRDSAVSAVLALSPATADAELVAFRREVERDIALGVPPGMAATLRVNRSARLNSAPDAQSGTPADRPRRP
jgi:hypothetical protein